MTAPKPNIDSIAFAPIPDGNAVIPRENKPTRRGRIGRLARRLAGPTLAAVFGLIFGISSFRTPPATDSEPVEPKPVPHHDHTEQQPRDPKWKFQLLLQAGDYKAAIALARDLVAKDQKNDTHVLRMQIGLCHEALGQWHESADSFRQLLDDPRLGAEARLALARVAIRSGHVDDAHKELHQLFTVTSLDSALIDEATIWWAVANDGPIGHDDLADLPVPSTIELVLDRIERTPIDCAPGELVSEPLAAWTRAASIAASHPFHDFAQLRLALLAHRAGRLNEAIESYNRMLAGPPSPASQAAAFNLGLIHFRSGSLKAARDSFQQVVDRSGNDRLTAQTWSWLGRTYLDEGNTQKARLPFRQAMATNGDTAGIAALSFTATYLLEDDANGALLSLKKSRQYSIPDHCRDFAALMSALARVELAVGRPGELQQRLPDLVDAVLSVEDATIIGPAGVLLYARSFRYVGMSAQAAPMLEKAADQSRGLLAVRINMELGDYHLLQHRHETAKPYYLTVAAHDRGILGARANRRLAEIALSAGRYDECLAYCQSAMEQPSTDVKALTQLMGQAHENAGDYANAAKCYAGTNNDTKEPRTQRGLCPQPNGEE